MEQEHRVILPFDATEPISGRTRRFDPPQMLFATISDVVPTVEFEHEGYYYLVPERVFTASCERIYRGPHSF